MRPSRRFGSTTRNRSWDKLYSIVSDFDIEQFLSDSAYQENEWAKYQNSVISCISPAKSTFKKVNKQMTQIRSRIAKSAHIAHPKQKHN